MQGSTLVRVVSPASAGLQTMMLNCNIAEMQSFAGMQTCKEADLFGMQSAQHYLRGSPTMMRNCNIAELQSFAGMQTCREADLFRMQSAQNCLGGNPTMMRNCNIAELQSFAGMQTCREAPFVWDAVDPKLFGRQPNNDAELQYC